MCNIIIWPCTTDWQCESLFQAELQTFDLSFKMKKLVLEGNAVLFTSCLSFTFQVGTEGVWEAKVTWVHGLSEITFLQQHHMLTHNHRPLANHHKVPRYLNFQHFLSYFVTKSHLYHLRPCILIKVFSRVSYCWNTRIRCITSVEGQELVQHCLQSCI